MESITTPAQVLQPPENSILHPVEAYLDRRAAQEPVHLVQYDTGIPVLTVALFEKDKPYAVPAGAAVNLRLNKPDGTCVYDPVLGLSQDRQTVYVQVSRQMTAAAGLANAILEILLNGGVVGTASFLLFLEANPVTDEAILSSGEFKSLDDYVNQAEASAASAQEAAERAQDLRDSIEMDYEYIEEAKKEAQDHAGAAGESAAQAKAQADRAKGYADTIQVDRDYIEKVRSDAQASATAAKESETGAKASEDAAAGSASAAKASQDAAAASASAAKTSEAAAKASETAAGASATAAKNSQTAAEESKAAAAGSASAAAQSAANAAAWAKNVEDMSNLAESYAVGGTDTRPNEDADNAKYYYEQAKGISQGLAGALLPMGTIAFAQLKNQTKQTGYMYNISDAFTTDSSFNEGTGHAYPAGTNVYYTAEGKWDCLAGTAVTGVKGAKEQNYRIGNVNITPDNIGALPSDYIAINPSNKGDLTAQTGTKFFNVLSNVVEGHAAEDLAILQVNSGADAFQLSASGNHLILRQNDNPGSGAWPETFTKVMNDGDTAAAATKLAAARKINGVEFDGSKDITVADGTKLPLAGGTLTGDVTMSGATRQIKYASGKRTAAPISFYAGDENGSGLVIGDGGRTIIGGGEAAQNLRGVLTTADSSEELHLANDGTIQFHTKCQTIGERHTFTFQNDGRFSGVANPTAATDAANKQYVDNALAAKQADIFYRSVSLTVAGWNAGAKTQTVAAGGVSATETAQLILPTPALASREAYQAAGIQVTAQGADSLTFTAATVPTVALTVYVVIIPL